MWFWLRLIILIVGPLFLHWVFETAQAMQALTFIPDPGLRAMTYELLQLYEKFARHIHIMPMISLRSISYQVVY